MYTSLHLLLFSIYFMTASYLHHITRQSIVFIINKHLHEFVNLEQVQDVYLQLSIEFVAVPIEHSQVKWPKV